MRRGWHAVVAAPGPFTAVDYRDRVAGLGVAGAAVVSGSFQGFDQSYLVGALAALDPTLVGVTQLRAQTRGREPHCWAWPSVASRSRPPDSGG